MNVQVQPRGNVLPGISNTQSYTLIIRNIFYDALDADPFFSAYTRRKNKMLVITREALPYLGVYIIDETMLPDGDANQAMIKFGHTARIGFSVIVLNNDQVAAEEQIDAAYWHIMHRLWTDPVIMNVLNAMTNRNPDNVRVESLNRGLRRHVYGTAQMNNETPTAEVQYDVSVFYRTYWEPIITDMLEGIDIRTGVKALDTAAEMANRKQSGVTVNFDTTPLPLNKPSRFDEFKQRISNGGQKDGK